MADGDKPAEQARSKGDALNAHECPEPSEHQARPDEGALDRRRVVDEPVGPEGEERREDEAEQGEVARDAARRARASVLARGGRVEDESTHRWYFHSCLALAWPPRTFCSGA